MFRQKAIIQTRPTARRFFRFPLKSILSTSLCFVLVFGLAFPLVAQQLPPENVHAATVSDYLQTQLASAQAPVSFLVVLRDQVNADQVLASAGVRAATRQAKANLLYAELTATAQRTQAPLRAWLDAQGIAYQAFYLINMLEVKGDAATVAALRERPEVSRLVANPFVRQQLAANVAQSTWLQPFAQIGSAGVQQTLARPYGLDYTHAPEVWALGFRGQGIVVASQDTGVQWDHPALEARYRGVVTNTNSLTFTVNHVDNWFDAWGATGRPGSCSNDPQVPCDDGGHGTHTVGTMLGDATAQGDTVLGMAPDAKWIACRNMKNGVGTPASYTTCFQFLMAPYPQDGDPMTDGHPELAPNIINNSWGCPPSEGCDVDSLRQVVENVRAADIMVVASAGNAGPNCSTVVDPIGIYDAVFSVGAHDSTGKIAGFSSRGPVTIDGSGRLKPDISAPGVAVRSTWLGNSYNVISGTSMAGPHVAGAVALLWSAVPALIGQIDLTEQLLLKSATSVPFNQCDGVTPVTPNSTYGYGRLNVLAAVQMAQQPAVVSGHVLDPQAAPLANVSVTVIDQLTKYQYQTTSGPDGAFEVPLYSGNYTATAQLTNANFTPQALVVAAGENKQVELQELMPTDTDPGTEPGATPSSLFLPWVVHNH
ncbi:MAG: S8 family serine peptidase [Chloroflexi bacterium]|nr:S8 family serine peptidase [Chloroflexota bacterium]